LWAIGGFTLAGIVCLVFAAVQLIRESLICLDVIRDHNEAVEKAATED
jgi:hypothetical protein